MSQRCVCIQTSKSKAGLRLLHWHQLQSIREIFWSPICHTGFVFQLFHESKSICLLGLHSWHIWGYLNKNAGEKHACVTVWFNNPPSNIFICSYIKGFVSNRVRSCSKSYANWLRRRKYALHANVWSWRISTLVYVTCHCKVNWKSRRYVW